MGWDGLLPTMEVFLVVGDGPTIHVVLDRERVGAEHDALVPHADGGAGFGVPGAFAAGVGVDSVTPDACVEMISLEYVTCLGGRIFVMGAEALSCF